MWSCEFEKEARDALGSKCIDVEPKAPNGKTGIFYRYVRIGCLKKNHWLYQFYTVSPYQVSTKSLPKNMPILTSGGLLRLCLSRKYIYIFCNILPCYRRTRKENVEEYAYLYASFITRATHQLSNGRYDVGDELGTSVFCKSTCMRSTFWELQHGYWLGRARNNISSVCLDGTDWRFHRKRYRYHRQSSCLQRFCTTSVPERTFSSVLLQQVPHWGGV